MKIFKTRCFSRWAKKVKLSDRVLCEAVEEMNCGLIDAKLAHCVYKKRVALPGRGKRASLRTVVAFKTTNKVFFIFGFAKNTMENVDPKQLDQLKQLAKHLMCYNDSELVKAITEKVLMEVNDHE